MAEEKYIEISKASKYVPLIFLVGTQRNGLWTRDENRASQIKISTLRALLLKLENAKAKLLKEKGLIDEITAEELLGEGRLQYLTMRGQLKPTYIFHYLNFFRQEDVKKYIVPPESLPKSRPPVRKSDPLIIGLVDREKIAGDLMTIEEAALQLHIPHSTFASWVMYEQLLPVVMEMSAGRKKRYFVRKDDVEALPEDQRFQNLRKRARQTHPRTRSGI